MDSYSTIKGLNFSFLEKVLGVKFFLTPRGMIPRGVSFFEPKSRITQRNLNQTRTILPHWSVAQADSNYL